MTQEIAEYEITEFTTDPKAFDHIIEQDDNLERYLAQIRKIFDIPSIIDAPHDTRRLSIIIWRINFHIDWD
jgi:hypothetical protein